jgi:hypothetical protein
MPGTPASETRLNRFLGFTHYCGQRNSNGAFIVWRITAKRRMAAKLKAIKAELQRRRHHRTTEVGAWLRKVVLGYYQYHAVPGNSTQLRIFSRRVCWLWRTARPPQPTRTGGMGSTLSAPEPVDSTAPHSAPLSHGPLCRHPSLVRAVCVNAHVRICAGGAQR